jgi:hypothetical protein
MFADPVIAWADISDEEDDKFQDKSDQELPFPKPPEQVREATSRSKQEDFEINSPKRRK